MHISYKPLWHTLVERNMSKGKNDMIVPMQPVVA